MEYHGEKKFEKPWAIFMPSKTFPLTPAFTLHYKTYVWTNYLRRWEISVMYPSSRDFIPTHFPLS
jgi:hypothetical protein